MFKKYTLIHIMDKITSKIKKLNYALYPKIAKFITRYHPPLSTTEPPSPSYLIYRFLSKVIFISLLNPYVVSLRPTHSFFSIVDNVSRGLHHLRLLVAIVCVSQSSNFLFLPLYSDTSVSFYFRKYFLLKFWKFHNLKI